MTTNVRVSTPGLNAPAGSGPLVVNNGIASVEQPLSLAHMAPYVTAGTQAARPAFGTAGRLYVCTDTFLVFYDTGAAWQQLSLAPNAGTGPVIVTNGIASVEQPLALSRMSPYNLRGTLAARPAFGTAGRRYLATDAPYEYFDTGAAWVAVPTVNRWFTLYDIDFTTLPLSTAAGNGNFTIDGRIWTVTNFGNSSVMSVGGADGLRLKANGNASSNTPPNRNGPLFQSPSLLSLINGVIPDVTQFGVRLTAYIKAATRNVSNDASTMFIDTGNNNQRHEYQVYNNGGVQADYMRLILNSSQKTTVTFTHLANHDVLQMEIPTFCMDVNPLRSGIYAAGWPTKMFARGQNAAAAGQWAPCLMQQQSDAFVCLGIEAGSVAGTSETKWGRMKIELMLLEPS